MVAVWTWRIWAPGTECRWGQSRVGILPDQPHCVGTIGSEIKGGVKSILKREGENYTVGLCHLSSVAESGFGGSGKLLRQVPGKKER